MSWFFEGNGQQIGFSVSENGVLSAYGRCFKKCHPDPDWIGIRSRMNGVAAGWNIPLVLGAAQVAPLAAACG